MKIGDIAIVRETHPIKVIRGESVVIRDIRIDDSTCIPRVLVELFYPVKTKYGTQFDSKFWIPARYLNIQRGK